MQKVLLIKQDTKATYCNTLLGWRQLFHSFNQLMMMMMMMMMIIIIIIIIIIKAR